MEKIIVKNLSSEEAAALIENKYPHLLVVNIKSETGMYTRKGIIGFKSYEEAKSILDSLNLDLFPDVRLLRTKGGNIYESCTEIYDNIDVYKFMINDSDEEYFRLYECGEAVLEDYKYILNEEEDPDIEEKVNLLKQKLDKEDFTKCMYRRLGNFDDYEMIEKYDTSYWSDRDGYSYHLGIDLYELDYE